jgi:uncharacterized protein (DUF302 family)
MNSKRTKVIVEHNIITTNKSFEQVVADFEERAPFVGDIQQLLQSFLASQESWEEATETIEKRLGKGGFCMFSKIDHGLLLSVSGKPGKVIQYTMGNPLLAIQMIKHVVAVGLYAPLKLLVHEAQNPEKYRRTVQNNLALFESSIILLQL